MAQDHVGKHDLGEFVAVLWEICNARDRCLFGSADHDVTKLVDKAISFVWLYREACDRLAVKTSNCQISGYHPLRECSRLILTELSLEHWVMVGAS